MTRLVRVALAQLALPPGAFDHNRARVDAALEEAHADRADLIVLPELCTTGYAMDPDVLAAGAEPVDGPTVARWTALAAATGMTIAGGLCERDGDDLFNTAVIVDPTGLRLHYRKLHLFDREKLHLQPGDRGLPVVDTALGRLGLCVCYDLRFVEVLRALALRGAELVCVPTAWTAGFDTAEWNAEGFCPQAEGAVLQANLDQVVVACASQVGRAGDARLLGSSVLVGPTGEVLAGPGSGREEMVATATVDLEAVAAARVRSERIRPTDDRRTDVYGLVVDGTTW